MIVAAGTSLTLSSAEPMFVTQSIILSPITDTFRVYLQRPTAVLPLAWSASAKVQVALVVVLDGVEHRCTSVVSGGIRLDETGQELPTYSLCYAPTWGFFGNPASTKRLGETAKNTYTGHVEFRLVAGNVAHLNLLRTVCTERVAPFVAFHSSVAFDAATDASENAGDGVVSLSHTATGSNLAAWAGCGSHFPPFAGSTTYAGSAMTELVDQVFAVDANYFHAAYVLAGIPSGASTVTNTLTGTPARSGLQVITMTGVDQTTPNGTAVVTDALNTSISVTVGSVNPNDLVVDTAWARTNLTVGVDQTLRNIELDIAGANAISLGGSTQPGSLGGVMSWTHDGTGGSQIGLIAVAFKPTAAAAPIPASPLVGNLRW